MTSSPPPGVSRLDAASVLAASVMVPLGLILAGLLVPGTVDQVSTSDAIGRAKVVATARHATEIRLGYLALVAGLLCIPVATRGVRRLAPARGAFLVDLGWRLAAIGAAAGAVGNAFAPLILPSTAGFDATTMGQFIHRHETSAASFAMIALYLLLAMGGVLLFIGLLRAGTCPRWPAFAFGAGLAAIPPLRLGPQSIIDGVLLGAALLVLHRVEVPDDGG